MPCISDEAGARATILYFGGNGYIIGRYGAWTASLFEPLGVDPRSPPPARPCER